MKILLIGEYSGFHNNLKEGLIKLGHQVTLAASSDGFKKLPADYLWEPKFIGKLGKLLLMKRIYEDTKVLTNYDIVQFINPTVVYYKFNFNKLIVNKLIEKNKKSVLVVAGDDYIVWEFFKDRQKSKEFSYNWVREIIQNNDAVINVERSLPEKWTKELIEKVNVIVPIAYEYQCAYNDIPKTLPLIPMPINVDKIKYTPNKLKNNKLVILHGLNRESAKGTMHIRKAFERLAYKYPNDLELILEGQMSQTDYLNLIQRTNVVVDQATSYSLAMNALYSMAMGKIVMGGAESINVNAMGYENCPAINIKPDADDVFIKITQLLDKRDEVEKIGEESRLFVEKYHHYVKVAQKYVDYYQK